jgi:hypothetical protein
MASCIPTEGSFKQNYARNFQKENVIFIKGVALNSVEYGRYIKVIEDLKGNFKGDSIILVWGAENPNCEEAYISNNKVDYLLEYQEHDTLIMLVKPVNYVYCIEVVNGYATFDCAYSVLKLSNGYVTGRINPYIQGESWQNITMSWEEALRFLSNDGYVNAFEADSVVWRSVLELNAQGIVNPITETVLYGDTIINEVKWKIVNQLWGFGGRKALVRTEEKKVFLIPYPGYEEYWEYLQKETLIYDFSLDVGDSFDFAGAFGIQTVISTDSIELNDGRKYKKLYFSHSWLNCVEGLGSDVFEPFFFLTNGISTSMPNFSTLMCCHVNGELLYMNPDYSDCEGNRVSNDVIVNPNPKPSVVFTNGSLRVAFDNKAPFDVAVYNLQGMLLAQAKNNRNEMLANLDNLPQGVYIVSVSSGSFVYSEKIVK